MYCSGKIKCILVNFVLICSLFGISCTIPTDHEKAPIVSFLPAPDSVNAIVKSVNSITVSWTAVPGAESYRLYRADDSSGLYKPVFSPQANSYTDTEVSPDMEYYYKVASIANSIEGEKSAYAFAATRLPAIPADIKTAILSTNSIAISWEAVSGALSYKVYRAEASDGPFAPISDTGLTANQYTDTTVLAASDYYYKVSAVNGIGEGVQSKAVPASTKIPATPAGLKTFTLSTTSIEIQWNVIPGTVSYKIYQSNSSADPYAEIGSSTEPSFVHKGVSLGSMYFYKVSAVNVLGESPLSDYVLGEIAVPPAPANVVAEGASESSIKISWDPVPGATMYAVQYNSSSSSSYSYKSLGSTTKTTITHNGLKETDYIYRYQVATINAAGQGPWSASQSGRLQPIPLSEGVWDTGSSSYYSFLVNGGTLYIQWSYGNGGEANSDCHISAYWSSKNSRESKDLEVTFFTRQQKGFATPRIISAPENGYIILYHSYISYYGRPKFSIRYYR
jgi:fibronectin type 3 domain-containing protein